MSGAAIGRLMVWLGTVRVDVLLDEDSRLWGPGVFLRGNTPVKVVRG